MGRISFKPGNILNPVPVVMVSVTDKSGKSNILTIAWTGTINSDPPMVSISVRKERYSFPIIEQTKEFVINLVTEDLTFACDYCGVKSGKDIDKFKEMKLTECDVDNVSAKGIEQSPVNIGCRVVEQKDLGTHTMFIAEVVGVNVDEKYMDETGKFDLNALGLVAYSHGEYFKLGQKIGKFGYSVKKEK